MNKHDDRIVLITLCLISVVSFFLGTIVGALVAEHNRDTPVTIREEKDWNKVPASLRNP